MRRPFLFCLILCVLTFSKPHAQNLFKKPAIGVQGFYGSFLTNHPKAQYLRDSYSYFGEVSLQQQTDGRHRWQIANGLPQVGIAFHFGNTGSRAYLGNMAALFPFVNWPLFRTRNLRSSLRGGAGFGWIQKPYDKITNHKNTLIGTYGNAYIHFSWQAQVRLFSNIHATAGLSFSHFSNGSTTLPNLGLNIPALAVGLQYLPAETPRPVKRTRESLPKKSCIMLFTTLGLKQAPWIESNRYLVNTFQAEWRRAFWASGSYSGGIVLFYDRALEVNPLGILDQKRKGTKMQVGMFAGYEHQFGRLSVPLQVGAYVYNHAVYTALFQQLGFRYRINPFWTAQLLMKTHSGKADFIHLGVGYKIK